MADAPKKVERPCRAYERGVHCADGREHCFNCGRHLDGERCPKHCGEGNEKADDDANNE